MKILLEDLYYLSKWMEFEILCLHKIQLIIYCKFYKRWTNVLYELLIVLPSILVGVGEAINDEEGAG